MEKNISKENDMNGEKNMRIIFYASPNVCVSHTQKLNPVVVSTLREKKYQRDTAPRI